MSEGERIRVIKSEVRPKVRIIISTQAGVFETDPDGSLTPLIGKLPTFEPLKPADRPTEVLPDKLPHGRG